MRRHALWAIALLLFLFIKPQSIFAEEKTRTSSATFIITLPKQEEDNRVGILEAFLLEYNSPLATNAWTFVKEADKNNLDWRFVASISGVESTFGRFLPPNSHNAWGWGIYGNNLTRFPSYDAAIETISHDLREKYMETWGATDVESIGRIYAADPHWAHKVHHFMDKIDKFAQDYESQALPLSI